MKLILYPVTIKMSFSLGFKRELGTGSSHVTGDTGYIVNWSGNAW